MVWVLVARALAARLVDEPPRVDPRERWKHASRDVALEPAPTVHVLRVQRDLFNHRHLERRVVVVFRARGSDGGASDSGGVGGGGVGEGLGGGAGAGAGG